jgi:hypothetical protein
MNKTALPKSPMGIALNYATQRWDNLLNYLYDGSLKIDNNWVENAIRPCTLGRKNYLFAGSHEGAKRAAMRGKVLKTRNLKINIHIPSL